jgi:outer membrane usher protein FimD/PapC
MVQCRIKVSTASIPYLTRPGSVRYKVFAGKPTSYDHSIEGETFGSGEFSWGVSNGWSLYGGMVSSSDYLSVAAGIGRDLLILGALSFDVTRSDKAGRPRSTWTVIPGQLFETL